MKRDRQAIENRASDWVLRQERGLGPDERCALAQWLAADARHRDAWRRHRQAWGLLQQAAAGITAARAEGRRRRARMIRSLMLAAAGVAAAALWGWWTRPPPLPAGARLLVPESQTLSDGSRIELRRGAEVTVEYSAALRRVRLVKGEALFHVAKNHQRPFVVSAQGGEVRAVGTAFAVALDGSGVDVIVTEGRVEVRAGTGGGAAGPIWLDAGRRLTLKPAATAPALPRAVSEAEASADLAWSMPRIELSNTPLRAAAEAIARGTAIRLVIDDPALAGRRVSGVFRAGDVATFVRLLEANFGVRADRSPTGFRLRSE